MSNFGKVTLLQSAQNAKQRLRILTQKRKKSLSFAELLLMEAVHLAISASGTSHLYDRLQPVFLLIQSGKKGTDLAFGLGRFV